MRMGGISNSLGGTNSLGAIDTELIWGNINGVLANQTDLDDRFVALEGDQHTHSNKAILDATTESFTSSDKAMLGDGTMITNADLNTILDGGRYGVIGIGNTNTPKVGEFYMEVLNDGSRAMQIATYIDGSLYARVYTGSWSTWSQFTYDADAVNYDGVASGLAATEVQSAIDETVVRVADLESDSHVHANLTNLSSINQDLATTSTPTFANINLTGGFTFSGDVSMTGIPVYADDATAGVGGLIAGDVYTTATGELRIKV